MRRRGFHTITLGCKLNQFDGAAIEGALVHRGFRAEADSARAEVVVLNTCTVTHRADAEARKLIRRVRRGNPRCLLLVTGCYAEADPEALRALDGVDRVFGNRDKARLSEILDELGIVADDPGSGSPVAGDRGCDAIPGLPGGLHFGERSRAFLKVQEGCRLACSYCIIPSVRGPSRSVLPDHVLTAASRLLESGFREIVLTGVNTGDYGRDLEPRTSLAALLERLLEIAGDNRIRLNSLEPLTLTDEIVGRMAADSRLAPHLQIPLQSGNDRVLGRMRRNYRRDTYLERLTRLRDAVPDACIGADVITGFPGETEEEFGDGYRFIAESPLDYLHVFSWSPRPGTPAAALSSRVPPRVIQARTRQLRELGQARFRAFRERFVGRRLDAVALDTNREGRVRALTGNYIEVTLAAGSAVRGERFPVRLQRVSTGETRAVRVPPAPSR